MISGSTLFNIKTWFNEYSQSYLSQNDNLTFATKLKIEHTWRVCKNIESICKSIKNMDPAMLDICIIIALLHDIGRFEQFKKYNTFSDRQSVDHASLAIEIIDKYSLLSGLSDNEKTIIKTAIQLHNVRELPSDLEEEMLVFCSLIRDADKIDIFKITAENYNNPDSAENKIVRLGVEELSEISENVYNAVFNGKSVDYSEMHSINDFRLVQLGWIFDLKFSFSILTVKQNGYYDIIKQHLPQTQKVIDLFKKLDTYIDKILHN